MKPSLLDTDTLSEIIKDRNQHVIERAAAYLSQFGLFTLSLITRYEILRGLKAKHAAMQLARFDEQCRRSHVLPLTDDLVQRAADSYAHLRAGGQMISDADLLIAATAVAHNLVLVTNNVNHFQRIHGVTVETWSA